MTIIYHILLTYKYEADDLISKNDLKSRFTDYAKKYSHCSSAKQGGYLGEYKYAKFLEEFSEVVKILKMNEISKPVRTKHGYHIILKKDQ